MSILALTDLSEEQLTEAHSAIRRIFFSTSSRQQFASQHEREAFFENWTSLYFQHYPGQILVAQEGPRTIGYLMGCPDSAALAKEFSLRNPSYALYVDLFAKFPAHLHINLSEEARGKGLGGRLVQTFCRELNRQSVKGVHIVTAAHARNCSFYRKEGFTFEVEREWKGRRLLFMGRTIERN